MIRTQIYLTEQEQRELRAIAHNTGKSQSELVRQAVDQFLMTVRPTHRQSLLRKARGIWQERHDLPDFRSLRTELDRSSAENNESE